MNQDILKTVSLDPIAYEQSLGTPLFSRDFLAYAFTAGKMYQGGSRFHISGKLSDYW